MFKHVLSCVKRIGQLSDLVGEVAKITEKALIRALVTLKICESMVQSRIQFSPGSSHLLQGPMHEAYNF